MKPQLCHFPDGTRIAYNIIGSGPALLLLHGLGKSRLDWHKLGYVDRLQQDFTVITVDLRGSGDSEPYSEPADYTIEKICNDLYAVADACTVEKFAVWGYSFGGNIARYLAAWSTRVTAVAVIGVPLGPAVDETFSHYINEFEQRYGHLAQAAQQGGLSQNQRPSVLKGHIPQFLACFKAMRQWPTLALAEIRCPLLLLAGTKNKNVIDWIETHRQPLAETNIRVETVAGLTHPQEFSQVERVFPRVSLFLKDHVIE
jgi:pimeloyl-ACP methyl ester carboxylesterase